MGCTVGVLLGEAIRVFCLTVVCKVSCRFDALIAPATSESPFFDVHVSVCPLNSHPAARAQGLRGRISGWFRRRLYRKAGFSLDEYEALRQRIEEAQ